MQRTVDESLSPLGNSVAESLVLARHLVLVAAVDHAEVGDDDVAKAG